MLSTNKISTNLWFDTQAEEAARYYVSIFKNASIGHISYYLKEGQEIHKMPEGSVMVIEFTLEGMDFTALNGGPIFTFNESVSFLINCNDQEEVDYYWDKLRAGGDPASQVCGWLKDKYGVSWQVIPTILSKMIRDKDKERAGRVMNAMLQMKKIDIAKLQQAYA